MLLDRLSLLRGFNFNSAARQASMSRKIFNFTLEKQNIFYGFIEKQILESHIVAHKDEDFYARSNCKRL
jgi:hypothetical protein